jgi:hypothetical protein
MIHDLAGLTKLAGFQGGYLRPASSAKPELLLEVGP